MAKLPHSLTDFMGFVDGVGRAGKLTEGTPPKFGLAVEEYIAAGMGGSVDIPVGSLEKMECTFSMAGVEADYYRHIGSTIGMTLRGSTDDGDTETPVIYQMRGLVREADTDAMKRKDKGMVKNIMTVEYCKVTIGGKVVIEADVMGKKFIVDGNDLLAAQRANLGL